MGKYVLSIDVGTSNIHCLIADLRGNPVSSSHKKLSYKTPQSLSPLGKEFEPDLLWGLICQTVQQAIQNGGVSGKDIAGVSATSQRQGVVFLDREGRELYGGPNIDLRALMEGLSMDERHGPEIYSICGHLPSFLFAPAKLKWFRINRKDIYQRIFTALSIGDWIIYKLSGEVASEVSLSCELGIIDLKRRSISERLLELWEIPIDIFPKPFPSGRLVGVVTKDASLQTSIPAGKPVALGGADTQCGLLGMGIKEGEVGIVAGWSTPVQMVLDKPVLDPKRRTWTGCHILQGRWVLESNAGETGGVYRWLSETLFDGEENYALMEDLAKSIPAGSEGTLAFVGPEVMNMSKLGLRLGGFIFPLPISFFRLGKGHFVRALLENICFAIKANLLQIEEISGIKAGVVVIGGGLFKSEYLCKILPSILNRPVGFSRINDVSALGAVMCASVGAGVYRDLEEAIGEMKPQIKITEPDPLTSAEYEEHYQRWVSIYKKLEGLGK